MDWLFGYLVTLQVRLPIPEAAPVVASAICHVGRQSGQQARENQRMAQKRSSRRTATEPPKPLARPGLADEPSRFMRLEREVEQGFRPQMLAALQRQVDVVAEAAGSRLPACPQCRPTYGASRYAFG